MPERSLTERINHPRTLVIDDDAEDRFHTARILKNYVGAQVDEAATLEEAYSFMSLQQYDLVVSDTQLPTGRGYDLLDEINGHRTFPVIGLSSAIEVRDNVGESRAHTDQSQSLYYVEHWMRRGAQAAFEKSILYEKKEDRTGKVFADIVKKILHDYYYPN
ncbi:MAG: response regulator [Candidatus Woesearchaeota archaeon]|jgi:CheY-like chemotaxis protein